MKKFKLLSIRNLVPQSKVQKQRKPAVRLAARLTQPAYDDYEEEPTTKLSTAFVVVLALHLVAVGGIYAFHSIKAKRREADGTALTASAQVQKEGAPKVEAAPKTTPPAAPATQPAVAAAPAGAPAFAAAQNAAGGAPRGNQAQVLEKAPAGPSAVVPQPAKPAPAANSDTHPAGGAAVKTTAAGAAHGSHAEAGAKTYTVQKGDNPVAIAKRLGVNYEALLKINGVEDPRRLQPGQVLKLPVRAKPGSN